MLAFLAPLLHLNLAAPHAATIELAHCLAPRAVFEEAALDGATVLGKARAHWRPHGKGVENHSCFGGNAIGHQWIRTNGNAFEPLAILEPAGYGRGSETTSLHVNYIDESCCISRRPGRSLGLLTIADRCAPTSPGSSWTSPAASVNSQPMNPMGFLGHRRNFW